jgi:hypothetical protein
MSHEHAAGRVSALCRRNCVQGRVCAACLSLKLESIQDVAQFMVEEVWKYVYLFEGGNSALLSYAQDNHRKKVQVAQHVCVPSWWRDTPFSLCSVFSTMVWVAMPAWSVPGTHTVLKPLIRRQRTMVSCKFGQAVGLTQPEQNKHRWCIDHCLWWPTHL